MVKTHERTTWKGNFTSVFTYKAFFPSQLKDTIINQMSNVKVTSLEQVTQMAAVVALATEQKDEISQNSQVGPKII